MSVQKSFNDAENCMNNEEKMAEIWIMYSGTAHNEITFILFYFIHVCSKVVTESSV